MDPEKNSWGAFNFCKKNIPVFLTKSASFYMTNLAQSWVLRSGKTLGGGEISYPLEEEEPCEK